MNTKELLEEIKNAYREYAAECAKNGGHEGTTMAAHLLSRVEAFTDLYEKYYGGRYEIKRFI